VTETAPALEEEPPPPADLKIVVKEEETAEPEATAAPDAAPKERDCKSRWGCWDLLHTTKGTVLGGRSSLGYVKHRGEDALTAGFMAIYLTEHFATHDHMAVHFAGTGGIGRGLAGTDGIIALALDFGFRADVTEASGPFLRFGVQGLFTGNRNFHVGVLEPLQARVGYQYLKGDVLVEAGATQGYVPLARYAVLDERLDFSRSVELGGYAALRLPPYRVNVSLMDVLKGAGQGGTSLLIGRMSVCSSQLAVALCADALYTRGQVTEGPPRPLGHTVQGGVTIGLSP
jgi:hypothetical protein